MTHVDSIVVLERKSLGSYYMTAFEHIENNVYDDLWSIPLIHHDLCGERALDTDKELCTRGDRAWVPFSRVARFR